MQHRFLPIFLIFAAFFHAGCSFVPTEAPIDTPTVQTATPQMVHTAAPTETPAPTATAAPRNILEGVSADTPVEQHPCYLAPQPNVRPDALPPVTEAPASKERGTSTVHTDGNYDYIRYDDGTAGLIGCHFKEATHVFDLPETVEGYTVTGLESALVKTFEPATHHHPRNDIIIRIPKTVSYIGFNFAEAETMLDITVEFALGSPYFQSVGNSIFSADGTLLHSYQSDPVMMHPQVYIVPATITHIGANAFFLEP